MEPNGPNGPTQADNQPETLQQKVQSVYPTPVSSSPVPEPPPPAKKNYHLKLLLLAIIIIGAAAAYWLVSGHQNKPTTNSSATITTHTQPKVSLAAANNYEVFSNPGPAKNSTYSLVYRTTGKKTQTGVGPTGLELITPIGSDSYLLLDPSNLDKSQFYLFSPTGFKLLGYLPTSLTTLYDFGQKTGPSDIQGYGSNQVIYQNCPDSSAGDCDLRIVNVITGQEKVIKNKQLSQYGARIATLSSDQKSLYFIGVAPNDLAALDKQAAKITGGGNVSENDQQSTQLYKLKITRSIVQFDIASQKVVSIKPATTQYTYYGKFWLSPNGQNLLYSNGGEQGELQYVRISDNTQEVIKLPKAIYATEPFGTTTVTDDPLYSPDGSYMAFVTYDPSKNLAESAGVIKFSDLSVKMIADETGTPSTITSYFNNFLWTSPNQFDFTAGQNNYTYKIDGTAIQTGSDFGNLLGIADGFH